MKRLRLFLAAIAVLSGLGLNAQSWTGSEVGEGYALLYNVGTGQYLTRGNGWGTQASSGGEGAALTVDLKAFDGKYKIRTASNGRGLECLSGGTVYTDQSISKNATWTFTEVDATNHIYNIISADNHGGGSENYLTAEGGESTIVGPGADGTSANAKWKIYLYTDQQEKLQTAMANATAEAPVDVTAYIKDGNFGAMSINNGDMALEFWTVTANNKNLNGGLLTNPCAETYRNGGGKISQTITVPNGTYLVKCQGFYRKDSGSTPSYLYANNETPVALQLFNAGNEGTTASMDGASTSFTAGYYDNNEIQVIVTGKTLTFGIEGQSGNWTCFDNFRLFYLGQPDLSEFVTALATAVQAAEAVEGTIPTAAYNVLAAIVAENNKTYTTIDEYSAAINAIIAATNTAIALQASYTHYNNIKAAIIAINSDINLTSADTQVEAATTNEEIDAAIATARTALKTYIAGIENEEIDLTAALLTNPGFESGDLTGWTNSGTINAQAQGNKAFDNTQDDYYAERWHVNGTVDLNQTITDMPVGYYQLSAYIYSKPSDGLLYANSTSTSVSTSKLYTVPFNLTEAGDIKFGASCTLTSST